MNTRNAIFSPVRTVSASDIIFASLESRGKVLAQVCTSNFTSLQEVVGRLKSLAGRYMGLARLRIRNMTQGWNMSLSLASRATAPQPGTSLRSGAIAAPAAAIRHRQPSLFP